MPSTADPGSRGTRPTTGGAGEGAVEALLGRSTRGVFLRAFSIFVGILLVLLLLAGWLLRDEVASRRAEEAVSAAQMMAEHADKIVGGNLALLDQVEWQVTQAHGSDLARDFSLHSRLRQMDLSRPEVQSVWLFGPDGNALSTSIQFPPPATNFSDRDYFRATAGGEKTYIGELIRGRITDELNFNLARRVEGEDGEFLGTVVVSLYPQTFSQFYASLASGADVAFLVGTDGHVLVAYPWPEVDPVGMHIEAGAFPMIPAGAGDHASILPLDPSNYDFVIRQVRDFPLYVAYGAADATTLRELRAMFVRFSFFAVPAVLGVLLLIAYGTRQASALDASRSQLRTLNRTLEARVAQRTEQLEESTQRLRLAASSAGLGIFGWNVESGLIAWENQRMFDIFERTEAEGPLDLEEFLESYVPVENRAEVEENARAMRAAEGFSRTMRIRLPRSGRERWITVTAASYRPRHYIGVVADVTEQTLAEERRALLLSELDHRVKNTLAIVQSIARQTFRPGTDLEVARESFQGRLGALARAHSVLLSGEGKAGGIRDAIAEALNSGGFPADRVALDGPDLQVGSDLAVTLGLAMHELSTNAMKYGALSAEEGRVDLRWSLQGNRLRLEWIESGGPPVAPPADEGFGSRLIGAVVDRHRGLYTRDFAPDGLRCTIELDLDRPDRGGRTGPSPYVS